MGKATSTAKELKKNIIRQKIQNANNSDLIVIPAKPIESVENSTTIHRVAAYCRVSTDDEAQTTSFELQKTSYTEMITNHPGWTLAGIYADEGISGTSFNHRDGMKQMLADCRAGKIDMIITKSIARFARNIVDCLDTVEMLKNLPHPVGVEFETEHLYTLDESGRMILAILSTVAEEESHTKSSIMNWSIENRFERGLFLTPPLYGYDQDPETDALIINKEEAKVVKICYCLYLNGFSFKTIAKILTELHVKTYTGKDVWNPSTIRGILQNERHYGAVLAHKTFTPSFLNHKAKKNKGDKKQYLREDDHEAIVSKSVFEAAQRKMKSDYGTSVLPIDEVSGDNVSEVLDDAETSLLALSVVDDGILKGYVPVNRNWTFTGDELMEASQSAGAQKKTEQEEQQAFTLDDYEVVSTSYFSDSERLYMTLNRGCIRFSATCMRKFADVEYVEILLNPVEKCVAIRPCSRNNPNAINWGIIRDNRWLVRERSCRGLINPVLALMGWSKDSRYRVIGRYKSDGSDQMLLFDLSAFEEFSKNDKNAAASTEEVNITDTADDTENTENTETTDAGIVEDDNSVEFGKPALFGILFEKKHYSGDWQVLRPARLIRYCGGITEEEMKELRKETLELLEELKGA